MSPEQPDGPPDGELGPQAAALMARAREELGQPPHDADRQGLDAIRARQALRQRRWTRSLVLGGVAAAAALALVIPRISSHRESATAERNVPPLAVRIEGASLARNGTIQAAAGAVPALRFGDGTRIDLGAGTKGRLASVDEHGAHVAIADGSAAVNVAPRPHARWQIDAGPFTIHVHGTVFTAAWNATEQRLDVRLQRGSISVDGPLTTGAIPMRAGQRLTVALPQSRVLLRPIQDGDQAAGDEEDAPAAHVAEDVPAAPTVAPAPATRAPARVREVHDARAWPAALAAGDFATIVQEASRDVGGVLRTAGADDLAALADAARYQRRDDLARRALTAQRQRFPRSPRAVDAAFFLGRLDENGGGGLIHALRWYDRYLEEAPNGAYAAEALGRRMIALRELYGSAAARPVAELYVRRFPRGSYAGAAHALLGDSPAAAP
ncbi:MAG: FecR domain-containing protein [Polyangia bacterium]